MGEYNNMKNCDCGKKPKYHFVNIQDKIFELSLIIKDNEYLKTYLHLNDDGDEYYMCTRCAKKFIKNNSIS